MKTAVQQIIEDLQDMNPDYYNRNYSWLHNLLEMEKQQTCIFGAKCCVKVLEKKDWSLEELYNETFNK